MDCSLRNSSSSHGASNCGALHVCECVRVQGAQGAQGVAQTFEPINTAATNLNATHQN